MNKKLIRKAAENCGGIVALSEQLGLSRGAASLWRKVPAEHVLRVEQITGVSRYRLRPDIFGAGPENNIHRDSEAAQS